MSNDLHTYIEPELEARITALVLGEVGEFDVDELERIIQEQPELQIFRRRMEAMHDLLGDTVKPEKDEAWQLSDTRRAELLLSFSKKPASIQRKSHVITRVQWRSAIGIAACLTVSLILYFSVVIHPPMEKFTPEIISYQAAPSDTFESGRSVREEEIVLESKSPVAASSASPSRSYRSSEVKEKDQVPTLEDLPQIAKLFKSKKKAEKGKDTSVARQSTTQRIQKRSMNRAVMRKPSAPSSSMAKVIAANTKSNSATLVPTKEVDVPDPTVDFGDGDDFGDGWGEAENSSLIADAGSIGTEEDSDGFTSMGSPIISGEKSPSGRLKRDLSERNAIISSGIEVPREEHKQNVDEVRKNLYMGEGYYNLGKYDEAEAEFKKVLLVDKYNKAARRWLEKSAATQSDYYRAAYDHTRASLLAEVDRAWEMEVPADKVLNDKSKISDESFKGRKNARKGGVELTGKKSDIKRSSKRGEPAKKSKPLTPTPKRPEPLPEETNTSAQPFSTFSLNVSDVSFKLAKVALLEKGQWPESTKVRTEEFVNAFDYGDPSPRRGESVACAIEQSAHPFLQQRNLLRIGMKIAALGRSTPLRLTVLLDNSGSMEREDREASVLAAIRVLAAQLGPQDKITLVGFARTPRLLADRISGDKAGQLVNIVANTPSEGGTNIEEALVLARKLAKRQHTEGAQDRIVLITDGVANLGNTVPDELSRQIEIMRQEGIAFDACGVGAEGLNDEILEAMTRKGDGRYYFLNRPEDADSGFAKQIAGALSPAAKNVKVQVVFNPKRVSKYRLLGFNKHRLNKEDFRNDQVDAAEMAAEEAGNAVYQIEVNPNGEGELGEVFVRFLDTNTNRMVERSWPMAYESKVKSFDLTTAPMQLAGVASQLGEKLHGTDAGSVRFQNISSTLGKLRSHYSHNQKVQDLIRMCEKVK